tara:strand:+ start:431 stop:1231 length:801 start_codon:yes stop_codon:yes gene_type:complete
MTKPKANKKLGQHYLNNQKTIDKICNDFAGQYDLILEIGPGPATLTNLLSTKNKKLILIEKDERFIDALSSIQPMPTILNVDALDCDINSVLTEAGNPNTWLVSNLPYNVGTPIMIKYMQIPQIKFLTLMFQKEVAQKIYLPLFGEKRKCKEMNSLHALINNFFKIRLLTKVPPGQFSPPPKVDSAVLSLEREDNPTIGWQDFTKYENFLRKLFSNRRKQIGSVLKNFYAKDLMIEKLKEVEIDYTRRSETLSFEEVIQIYKKLEC